MSATPAEWTVPALRIDVDGDWFDAGVRITHAGVLANLRENLRRDAEGYFIQTLVRIPVEVDDVPWVVTRIEPCGVDLCVQINDGSTETIDAGSIRLGRGNAPYCAVKGGAFEARFDRAAAFQLLSLAEYDEATGRGALHVRGREYILAQDGEAERRG